MVRPCCFLIGFLLSSISKKVFLNDFCIYWVPASTQLQKMASVPTLEEMLRSLDAPPAVDPLVEKILRSLLAVVVERSVVETNVKLIESMEQYQTRRWDNVLRGEEELWRRRRKDRLAKAAVAAQRRREEQDRHQLKMVQVRVCGVQQHCLFSCRAVAVAAMCTRISSYT